MNEHDPLTTINVRAVAKRAKVSMGTVSRVLNDDERSVTEETRKRVIAALKELGDDSRTYDVHFSGHGTASSEPIVLEDDPVWEIGVSGDTLTQSLQNANPSLAPRDLVKLRENFAKHIAKGIDNGYTPALLKVLSNGQLDIQLIDVRDKYARVRQAATDE